MASSSSAGRFTASARAAPAPCDRGSALIAAVLSQAVGPNGVAGIVVWNRVRLWLESAFNNWMIAPARAPYVGKYIRSTVRTSGVSGLAGHALPLEVLLAIDRKLSSGQLSHAIEVVVGGERAGD